MPKNNFENLDNRGGTVIINNESEKYTVLPQLTKTIGSSKHFIGRTKELEEIESRLQTEKSLLINGIGGIGKSSLAMKFLHQQKQNYNHFGFIVALSDLKSALYNYLHINLRLKEYSETDKNFDEALRGLRALEGEKLLVIDDVQGIAKQTEAIEALLELSEYGYKILFTSREVIEDVDSYYLDVLSLADAKELFRSIYPTDNDELLEEILGYLDCYAFFIEKIAITLKVRKKSFGLEQLKEKFDNKEFSKLEIKTNANSKEKNNIEKLLDELFTFDALDDEDILLLKQLSVFPSIEISYNQLVIFLNKKEDEDFEDLLSFLVAKGWLYAHNNNYKLHQITKEYILVKHKPKTEEIDAIVLFFAKMIQGQDIQTAKLLQGYIVYFEEIISLLGRLEVKFNEKIVEFFDNLGLVYYHLGAYKKAELLLYKVMQVREKVLGEEHPDTGASYNNLAALYESMGVYERAEPLYDKALKISKKVLGEEHPHTGASYNNLAALYESMGVYERAEPLYDKALKIRKKVLGEEHPHTGASYNNLAAFYASMGAYEKAEPLFEKALKISEEVLGEEHPDTATSYNNLAGLYRSMGAYEKAEPLYKKALKIREEVLGEEHPDTATSYNNLATLYESMGAYEKAEPLYKKALKISEEVLGEEHPHTGASYNNLAGLYESMGAYERAEPLYDKALKISKKVLGEEHPDTATSYNNLAGFYYNRGDFQKAYLLIKKAVAIREKVLSEKHPDLIGSKKLLGMIEQKLV